ncbi:hypothetical protein EUX98_g4266 [Antrodiella citrinella]|uniref:Uncharacterized protein n=1 Tax=Antrodiella citrinella TaxID=2447956 RepID=A0A4S4MWF7_9APHY|nr:hypothetical protein EUX98_g4266 [Antrodiella citrinella]
MPAVHIVSSAPEHVFADSIALGAQYRHADIDPVVVQPVAYRVDRRKSVDVLRSFLKSKGKKIEEEKVWLENICADCVMSDAAFLGCSAANAAGLPSILITNFSFDSVYSYLSTSFIDQDESAATQQNADMLQAVPITQMDEDIPILEDELAPLVNQIIEGYRCANLLLRLPGAIPIPSFSISPSLPSPQWVDPQTKAFRAEVLSHLTSSPLEYHHHPHIPFPLSSYPLPPTPLARKIILTPLVVRSPNPEVYTPGGRKELLDSLGVPAPLQDPASTKILLISFGGQSSVFSPVEKVPSDCLMGLGLSYDGQSRYGLPEGPTHAEALSTALTEVSLNTPPKARSNTTKTDEDVVNLSKACSPIVVQRQQSQFVVAGAPPASLLTSPTQPTFVFADIATPDARRSVWLNGDLANQEEDDMLPQLFPNNSWIAIVCGVSKTWAEADGEQLPHNFFVAPKEIYMPDVTAVADVLLGKLGYGTVSECVDACTPFVYVPRPLFIEEFGLRLLLQQEGVGVELSRASYESGEWASAIEEAWQKGRARKAEKREEGETGKRREEGRVMAETIVQWIEEWKKAQVAE